MKVLLINPKIAGGNPWIPLGLANLAAYLRKYDINVKIIDTNFTLRGEKEISLLINEYKPDIVGTGGMTIQCNNASRIGELVKGISKDIKLVYGGVHFTFRPEDGLKYGDVCVIGEGEETFLEICRGSEFRKIKGIAFKENGEIILTGERPFIHDLDVVPFPAYDLLEVNRYEDKFITGERAISMMTGRGCPYNCKFCASPQLWKRKVRFHSMNYIMQHIDFLIREYHLKNLRIMDDTFTISKSRVLEFCDEIEKRGFNLKMTCLTNVKNADYQVFNRMKEVGFSIIAFGVESGNETILRMINKGIAKDDVRNAIAHAKRAGLNTELLFMVGNIGETKNTIFDSINFAKELNPIGSNFSKDINVVYNWFQFATPFPGSEFYNIAKQYGIVITEDWDKYHHQDPVFVPKDLNKKTMIKLKDAALFDTNSRRFRWVPPAIRRNNFIRQLYKLFSSLKNSLSRAGKNIPTENTNTIGIGQNEN